MANWPSKQIIQVGWGGWSSTFLGLSDTPTSYTGQALKWTRVNAGETALEFFTLGGGTGTVTDVSSTSADLTVTNPTTTPALTVVSAPKLTTARNINGVAFDWTGNITIVDSTKQPVDAGLTSISALTGAGYVKATATDTFSQVATIPNTDISGLGTLSTQTGTFSGTSSGTNTGDQTSIVGITGTKAQFDTAVTDGNIMYVGDAPTAHTHLLANITDVTMTVANLNSLDDGVNTALHFHDADRARANHTGTQLSSTISDFTEASQDAIGAMVDTTLVYNDATPSIGRAALTGAITASAGSNATALGSFTTAQLNTALSDNDVATGGGTATGTNTGDNAVNTLYSGLVSNATHTGDATGATALTLATVNSNVGTFGSATQVASPTVNAKGLVTAVSNIAIAVPSTAITDFASASRAQTEAELVAGTNITITPSGTGATRQLTIASTGGGGTLTVQDEWSTTSTTVTTLNFTGAGVTASGAGATATINIGGGGWSSTKGIAEVDFGAITQETDMAVVTITDASITTTSYPSATMYWLATSDHDPDDYVAEWLSAYVTNIINWVSFQIAVHAENLTWWKYKVTYLY